MVALGTNMDPHPCVSSCCEGVRPPVCVERAERSVWPKVAHRWLETPEVACVRYRTAVAPAVRAGEERQMTDPAFDDRLRLHGGVVAGAAVMDHEAGDARGLARRVESLIEHQRPSDARRHVAAEDRHRASMWTDSCALLYRRHRGRTTPDRDLEQAPAAIRSAGQSWRTRCSPRRRRGASRGCRAVASHTRPPDSAASVSMPRRAGAHVAAVLPRDGWSSASKTSRNSSVATMPAPSNVHHAQTAPRASWCHMERVSSCVRQRRRRVWVTRQVARA